VLHETLCTLIELYEAIRMGCKAKQAKLVYDSKEEYLKKALSYQGTSVYIVNMNQDKLYARPKQNEHELDSRRDTQGRFLQKKTRIPGRVETYIKREKQISKLALKIKYSLD
jgi:hypothetical protein